MSKKTDFERDWAQFDAKSAASRTAAAEADPDALPLNEEDLSRLAPVPRITTIRRALGLSQEAFASRFHLPLGTIRDWEQGRKMPDAAARAYLKVIAGDPEAVAAALDRKAS